MYKLIFKMVLILPFALFASDWNVDCVQPAQVIIEKVTPNANYLQGFETVVFANKVLVTGEGYYHNLPGIKEALQITQQDLMGWQDKKVLSLGEGYSDLVPFLVSRGIDAKALDIWYGVESFPDNLMGQKMQSYVQKYGDYLIPADARSIPLPDHSVDVILEHQLISHASIQSLFMIMSEIKRVLRPGGQARLFEIRDHQVIPLEAYLKQHFRGLYQWEFNVVSETMDQADFIHHGTQLRIW